MKILWLINIPLPEASLIMGTPPNPFGGWLINPAKDLAALEDCELIVLFPQKGINNFIKLQGEKITYYAFKPVADKDKKLIEDNKILTEILKEIEPDLVHVFGTEAAHTLSMVNVCNKKNIKTVISIQGLVSIIGRHMFANLPWKVVYGFTLRNLLRMDNVIGLQKIFCKRGKNELKAITETNHIIGRTTWDKACIWQLNPNAKYHFCYETLREEFYKHEWNIDNCEKYSILLSQGQYPIKGLHYVLDAMPIILKSYPGAKLYISGNDITKAGLIKNRLLMTYYGKYITKMIRKNKLEQNIVFTGLLNEKQMCERFLKSHVFISASTIENESNSLSEAKILGVPAVASYVGGVTDRIQNGYDGFLYQHDATYMLAYYVCKIFENEFLALDFSKKARENALKIHDRQANTNRLLEIYKEILS